MASLLDTALAYHRAGLVVLPNDPARKYPSGLSGWQQVAPTEADIRRWFGSGQHAIGVRDVEGIDIDNKGHPDAETLYRRWAELVEGVAPGLVARLLCERTPSGGYHLVWRCETIAGNQKLATRPPTDEERAKDPKKTHVPLIETRGKGGQFQVAPSPGYAIVRGSWTSLPRITPAERQLLLDCARALSKSDTRTIALAVDHKGQRPGDLYNEQHASDALGLLETAGWSIARTDGDVLYLTRPGGTKGHIHASYGYVAPGIFYVFTTNGAPFQDGKAYTPFAIYTELEHGGDYRQAAAALRGRQEKPRISLRAGGTGSAPRAEYVVDWRRQGVTAAQLYATHFDPLYWTVENILPEGAALLAGKPKSRKSWAALAVGTACATGDKALGKLGVRQGRVLYLDLESNQRRMRGRLFSMLGHRMSQLENLHIYTDWPRGEEGIAALEAWMEAHPDTVLIVIDVLADFRRGKDPKEDAYQYDRETVQPINAFAERHRITVLLVHHTRKAKADDVFDEVSGSTGLVSAVATTWILGRAPNGSGETILTLRGRDLINDEPLALEWDDYHNSFVIIGGAVDALQGGERRAVLKVMADDAEWGPREIAIELKKSVASVQQLLKALLADGLVERTGYGRYVRVVTSRDQNDQSAQSTKNHQNDQIANSDPLPQDQSWDQSCVSRPNAVNGNSDHSDRDSIEPSLAHVPPAKRTLLRLFLRGNKESDQDEARQLCERYGIDYEQARKEANQ
jgi:hypothetical protein